jgi:glycosyltransferase involved in cell wall biosynthesis
MRRVLTDPTLAATLTERGLARAAEFSWERSVRQINAIYRELAAGA